MQLFKVRIKGISPLLMNKFVSGMESLPVEKAVESVVYRDRDGYLAIPMIYIQQSMRNAAGLVKVKEKSKKSAEDFSTAVFLMDGLVTLVDSKGMKIKKYMVDTRMVVNRSIDGIVGRDERAVKYRPMISDWSAEFVVEIDETLVATQTVHTVLGIAGSRVGVGDFRPQTKGPFGRFVVSRWERLD